MLARHGESLFWAGRYLERAEDTARMLEVTFRSTVSAGRDDADHRWRNLLSTLRLGTAFAAGDRGYDAETIAIFLVADRTNPGSVISAVTNVRENLRSLRELIPSELFEQANRFHLELTGRDLSWAMRNDPFELLDRIRVRCQTLIGIANETMTRDEGYRFLVLGQSLERALMTCRSLNVGYPAMVESSIDEVVLTLRSVSGLEAFRRRAMLDLGPDAVARFLLLSTGFPRSVLFCLRRAEEHLRGIQADHTVTRPARQLGQLRSRLEFADPSDVTADLLAVLDDIEEQIRAIAEAVARQYFRSAEELDLHAQLLLPDYARMEP